MHRQSGLCTLKGLRERSKTLNDEHRNLAAIAEHDDFDIRAQAHRAQFDQVVDGERSDRTHGISRPGPRRFHALATIPHPKGAPGWSANAPDHRGLKRWVDGVQAKR